MFHDMYDMRFILLHVMWWYSAMVAATCTPILPVTEMNPIEIHATSPHAS